MPSRLVAAFALLLVGPTPALAQDRPGTDLGPEWAAVEAANQRFARAERSGSLDSIAAAVWYDAVLLPPVALAIRGHEAILEFLVPDSGPAEASASTPGRGTVVSAGRDMAVIWGPGSRGTSTYKFVSVMEKRAGDWKLLLNTWNPRRAPAADADDGGEIERPSAEAPLSVEAAADRAAVRAANRRFSRAENSESLDSIAAAVWPDGVVLPPGRRWEFRGHEQIYAFVTPGPTPDSAKSTTRNPVNLLSAGGDMAVLSGTSCRIQPSPDGPVRNPIKFLTVLDKRDGEWKVLLRIWNPLRVPEPAPCESG